MPARRPHSVRVIELDPSRREPPDRPMPPPAEALKCPTWVPAEGRKEWRRLVPELERLGLVSSIDVALLAGYCAAYGRMVEAEKAITRDGIVVEGHRHIMRKHPMLQVQREQRAAMVAIARELGLSPKAREAISVPPPADDDDDSDLFDDPPTRGA